MEARQVRPFEDMVGVVMAAPMSLDRAVAPLPLLLLVTCAVVVAGFCFVLLRWLKQMWSGSPLSWESISPNNEQKVAKSSHFLISPKTSTHKISIAIKKLPFQFVHTLRMQYYPKHNALCPALRITRSKHSGALLQPSQSYSDP